MNLTMISLNSSTIKQMYVYIHCTQNKVSTRLKMVYAVTQDTRFTKAFFTFKMLCALKKAQTRMHAPTCPYTHTRYLIYAHKESKAFPESSFTRLINAQQCYVHISYPILPTSDNTCEKYGYKLIYTSK
jgi:hypothetical protein